MGSLLKYPIGNLNPNINNALTIGVVINKSDAKIFDARMGETQSRGVITFTVRDSSRFCNCTVWGSDTFVQQYDRQFKYGDVVSIMRPDIVPINANQSTMQPVTSLPYCLTIKETKGCIAQYDGDRSDYVPLLKMPLKSTQMTLNLVDINANGKQGVGNFVDVLVAVRQIKPVRQIKLKTGEAKSCREIIVMDRSFAGMSINIWRSNLIERSNNWQASSTVLHILNARTEYSDFYRSTTIGIHGRTVILENPATEDANALSHFALTVPMSNIDIDAATSSKGSGFGYELNVDLLQITNVMSVRQVIDRFEGKLFADDDQFTALVFAVVTHLDLDGCTKIFATRCIRCKKQLGTSSECDNPDCVVSHFDSSGQTHPKTAENFEISVAISDHTGTLPNCRLIGTTAERVLGHTVDSFKELSDDDRGRIKWQYLLERCQVKLMVKRKSTLRQQTFIQIMDCAVADPDTITAKIKVY